MSISEYKASTPAAAGGAPPPPPPPPPPGPPPPPTGTSAPAAGGGVAAVFAELNRGAEVTKNLRKVDKSEMTHKNPALRASSAVPSTVGSSASGNRDSHSSEMFSDVVCQHPRSQSSQRNLRPSWARSQPNLHWKETSGPLYAVHIHHCRIHSNNVGCRNIKRTWER